MSKNVLIVQSENCTGCNLCALACSSFNEGQFNPEWARIYVSMDGLGGWSRPIICLQCEDALCMTACSVDAIYKTETSKGDKIIKVDSEKCIECAQCVEACPYGAINFINGLGVVKCDLCDGIPYCVKFCTYNCLDFIEISDDEYTQRSENIKLLTNRIKNEAIFYDLQKRRLLFSLEAANILKITKQKDNRK